MISVILRDRTEPIRAQKLVFIEGMWDEEDGFYYDMLRFPDGRTEQLNVRSVARDCG